MNIYSCVDSKNIDKIFVLFYSCFLNTTNKDSLKFYIVTDRNSYDISNIPNNIKHIIKITKPDMVFISCTSIKFMDFIPELEKLIGIPVTTSNQAIAWHCMRLAGVNEKIPKLGRLFLH